MSKLPRLVQETKADFAKHGLQSTIVGHVGDGNFHAFLLFKDDKELQAVEEAVHRLVHRALALDGTCKTSATMYSQDPDIPKGTGEHGVGIGKKEYLVEELGPGTIALMRKIKHTIDPLNIMNPGKVFQALTSSISFLTCSNSCILTRIRALRCHKPVPKGSTCKPIIFPQP